MRKKNNGVTTKGKFDFVLCQPDVFWALCIFIASDMEPISSTFYTCVFAQKSFAQPSLHTFQLCNFWRQNIGTEE